MRVTAFRVGSSKGKAIVVLLVFSLFIFFLWRSVHKVSDQLLSVELLSETFPGQITVRDAKVLKAIAEHLSQAGLSDGQPYRKGRYKMVLHRAKSVKTYLFDRPGYLYEPRTGKWLVLPDGGKCLKPLVEKLEMKNPYGEFLTWDEVGNIFRKFDKARVVDFDSGLSFAVQRRAGSHHADVQPLTAEDTAVMKTIYRGQWSWKRRAVIVEVKGHRIAASMNGMPHGAGAIAGNNFNGHFCIHFRNSKTHSNEENFAHQLMIWKSAGKTEEMLADASPEKIVRVLIAAMEQGDSALAASLFQTTSPAGAKEIAGRLDNIKWLAVSKISTPREQAATMNFNLIVSYGLSDGTQSSNRRVSFIVVRNTGTIPWKISPETLDRLLDKQKNTSQNTDSGSVYRDWYVDSEL